MHWRFVLNSALVIKPSERSDVNTLRRCFRVWVSEAFGTSNEGTGAGRNFDTRKKGIGVSVDDLNIDLCDRKPFGSDLNDCATDTGGFTVW